MLEVYGGSGGMATPTIAVSNSCPADLHAVKRELSGECGADCRLAQSIVMSLLPECVFLILVQ